MNDLDLSTKLNQPKLDIYFVLLIASSGLLLVVPPESLLLIPILILFVGAATLFYNHLKEVIKAGKIK